MTDGMMTQQWTVWCADCTAWEMASGTKQSVADEVKHIGWRKVRGLWRCPSCITANHCHTRTEAQIQGAWMQ